MGMGYEPCTVCGDAECDWYEVDTMGMCRDCARDTMAKLQQQVESLQRQLEYRNQQIERLKTGRAAGGEG